MLPPMLHLAVPRNSYCPSAQLLASACMLEGSCPCDHWSQTTAGDDAAAGEESDTDGAEAEASSGASDGDGLLQNGLSSSDDGELQDHGEEDDSESTGAVLRIATTQKADLRHACMCHGAILACCILSQSASGSRRTWLIPSTHSSVKDVAHVIRALLQSPLTEVHHPHLQGRMGALVWTVIASPKGRQTKP